MKVKNPSDLFSLKDEDLLSLSKFKEKKAKNLLFSLQKSKIIDLKNFLYALGISEVGNKTASDFAITFGSLDRLKNASYDEILDINDVGPIIAKNVYDYFNDEQNLKEIENLLANGVQIKNPEQRNLSSKISGKTFVLTGTLENMSRKEASDLIIQNGANVSNSVSKNTDFVLVGENPGSKLDKAKALGIKIISEDEFNKMIGD